MALFCLLCLCFASCESDGCNVEWWCSFCWAIKTSCVVCLANIYLLWDLALDGEEKWENNDFGWLDSRKVHLEIFKKDLKRSGRIIKCIRSGDHEAKFLLLCSLFLELVRIMCEMNANYPPSSLCSISPKFLVCMEK